MASRQPHKLEYAGSIPASATGVNYGIENLSCTKMWQEAWNP